MMTVRRYGLLAVALVLGAVLVAPGLTNENAVSLQGDMPRYLMNGVFISDFLRAGVFTPTGAMDFAQHYFARYPALSLGHHPPLLPVLLVPFFEAFGVSVFAGRMAIAACFLLTIVLVQRIARRVYDDHVGGWASVLFATTPLAVDFGQQVMAEMPAIALITLSVLCLLRFRSSGRTVDYVGVVVTAVLSLACRQTAVFAFPAYAVLLLRQGGLTQILRPATFWMTVVGAVGLGLAIISIIVLSPFNTSLVVWIVRDVFSPVAWSRALATIVTEPSVLAIAMAAAAGVVAAVRARDGRAWPAAWWALSVLACTVVITGEVAPVRYSTSALPALAILAASLAAGSVGGARRALAAIILVVVVVAQVAQARQLRPVGAAGYEAAASHVVQAAPGSVVLYSASVDTGYFVFFVRKHDPNQRMVVRRADKLLTTSFMADVSLFERIESPSEIYPLLDTYGIRFVVLEDRPSGAPVIDWLRDEARTAKFAERRRFATDSNDPRLRGVEVVVYEYLPAREPAPDAVIDINLPLVGREIRLPLRDLLEERRAP